MDPADTFRSTVDSPRSWSLSAGLYMFICGTVVTVLLSDILGLLADVIGLPSEYWMVILASPTFAIGAVVWWTLIERRGSYTYVLGSVFGLVTALFTGVLWTGQFILIWGIEMAEVPVVAFLIGFVIGIVAIAGVLTALPLMYARRHLESDPAERRNHPM
ncbi:hypothetical protein [Haloarcula laminariae]|uniref:hypothetical protein n=1 Tax=Haloarcula laminariae TaxID=2961577 RepID=UPI0021C5E8C0|nr:hypothetical protein [Halomicroarcula laminariae]